MSIKAGIKKIQAKVQIMSILPKKENWTQITGPLVGELEETEYILILVFYQTGLKDKDREHVIGHAKFTIPWSPPWSPE